MLENSKIDIACLPTFKGCNSTNYSAVRTDIFMVCYIIFCTNLKFKFKKTQQAMFVVVVRYRNHYKEFSLALNKNQYFPDNFYLKI